MTDARNVKNVQTTALVDWFRLLMAAISATLPIMLWLAIGLSLLYAATILYGYLDGFALPTAAIFFTFPHAAIIGRGDFAAVILCLALVGAGLGWAARFGIIDASLLVRSEIAGSRLFLRYFLLPIFMMLIFVISSGGWAGRIEPGFSNYTSLGGLVPYSDAAGHFSGPVQEMITGVWSSFSSRRPMAAGFRQLTMAIAGLSYTRIVVVQTVLLSLALFGAARSIILWRGLWPGIAFCGFVFILLHPFLNSALTEPLGLIWALASVMFAVDAMRFQKSQYAFLALAALTVAELIRMGSLFTVPAVALWIALMFGKTIRERLKLLAGGAAVILAVLGVQALCSFLYGNPGATTGGNFAFTLCGLAVGGEWTSCPQLYAQEFSRLSVERDQAAFLYSKAIEIIAHNPIVLIKGLAINAWTFLKGIPNFMLAGYWNENQLLPKWSVLALLPGLVSYMRTKATPGEASLWVLLFGSMTLSAMIIFRDDGWRAFYATWPFVALFFSLGFVSPVSVSLPARPPSPVAVRSATILTCLAVCAIVLAPGVTRVWPGKELQGLSRIAPEPGGNEVILIGQTLTGFVVIPDSDPLPKTVPALHASDFARLIRYAGLEKEAGKFLDAATKRIPFAFGTGMRTTDAFSELFIAPMEILTAGPAKAWRIRLGADLGSRLVHNVNSMQALY